jgi:hypothetical protein
MANKEWDNNMRGVLFVNDKKGIPTRADYTGTCEINHVEYWMDVWLAKSQYPDLFSNVRFRVKGVRASRPQESVTPPLDFDDEIPF